MSLFDNALTDLSIRMSYYRHRILSLAARGPIVSRRYLEIGAGFGALARYLLDSPKSRDAHYVICDLPEFLPVCYWYLRSSDIDVAPFGGPDSATSRVLLTTGEHLPHVGRVDVAINTMSFQHMTIENIRYYLGQLDALGADAVFLVNRDTQRDPTDVPISRYPRPAGFRVESDHGAWTGGTKHREQVWRRVG
jgi:putative sugar O-methyltransferase